ncbi:unnamed protein product [Cylicocyclus nassatus]|uniref:Uncharacterized protein n=1 Tax=Cylicocyclus nassatus TaxID=53992 RepID=A0AA36M867_CYLNA|nr:unnamed protein product [Cylicocyclus nassatus]
MFFTTPASFNSNYVSWFFNPMTGQEVFLQSFLICLINVIAAYIYVYMQYGSPSKWFVITGQIAWQLSAGFVCIIYLAINRTIRRGVLELLVPQRWMGRVHSILMPTTLVSGYHSQSGIKN